MQLKSVIRKIWIFSFAVSVLILILFIFLIPHIPDNTWAEYKDNQIIHHSLKSDIFSDIPINAFLLQILAFIGLIVLNIINKIKNKAKIYGSIALSSVLLVFSFLSMGFCMLSVDDTDMSAYNPVCYSFTDNNHTIVIEEYSYMLMGGADVWQLNGDNTLQLISRFSTDDGGRNKGAYEIDWSAESVAITYNYFNLDNDRITKKFDFS